MRKPIRIAIAAAAMFGAGLANAADITVKVDGVKDDRGTVRLMLFDAASWPRQPIREEGMKATPGSVTVVLKDVAPGEYVAVAYHDENGNGRIDMSPNGMPEEPFAVTKDPDIADAPPEFVRASFALKDGYTETVKLRSMR